MINMFTIVCVLVIFVTFVGANSDHQCETKTFDNEKMVGYCCVHFKKPKNQNNLHEVLHELENQYHKQLNKPHNHEAHFNPHQFKTRENNFNQDMNPNFPDNPFLNNKNKMVPPPREQEIRRPLPYNRIPEETGSNTNYEGPFSHNHGNNGRNNEMDENMGHFGSPGTFSKPEVSTNERNKPKEQNEGHFGSDSIENSKDTTSKPKTTPKGITKDSSTQGSIVFPGRTEGPSEDSTSSVENTTVDLNNRNGYMDVPPIQCPNGQGRNNQGQCVDEF